MRQREIRRHDRAGRGAYRVEAPEAEMVGQGRKVAAAGARPVRGPGVRAEMPATGIADDAEAGRGEGRALMLPHRVAAGAGMQQHHGLTVATGVPIGEPHIGQRGDAFDHQTAQAAGRRSLKEAMPSAASDPAAQRAKACAPASA